MKGARSRVLRVCAEGPFALFTSPAFKVEKVSYDVMTPTAARGLVQAICWKPAVEVDVERIDVCTPIRRVTMTVNGVAKKARMPTMDHLRGRGRTDDVVQTVPGNNIQTRHVLLRDVRYVVSFRYVMTERAAEGDNPAKFEAMFTRRLERGQHFRLPHFGMQQHVAFCRPATADDVPIDETRDLGMMPHCRIYGPSKVDTLWFHARLDAGSVAIPSAWDRLQEGAA